ncbi:MAG TPA: hypothetical protein VI861_02985 [Rickettsiales bacterium]|nr:hypothetical protein [Rickettsiales bacterium]
MQFLYFIIAILLIILTIVGFCGLYFYKQNIRKICCLSISYSSFLLLIVILSFQNNLYLNTILAIMVSVLIIFCANLAIAIGILKNS